LVDPVIGLFTNLMMIDGKKMAAQSQMTEILQLM
jgi:ribosomal protein S7